MLRHPAAPGTFPGCRIRHLGVLCAVEQAQGNVGDGGGLRRIPGSAQNDGPGKKVRVAQQQIPGAVASHGYAGDIQAGSVSRILRTDIVQQFVCGRKGRADGCLFYRIRALRPGCVHPLGICRALGRYKDARVGGIERFIREPGEQCRCRYFAAHCPCRAPRHRAKIIQEDKKSFRNLPGRLLFSAGTGSRAESSRWRLCR